ncbi:MAG: uncharacterized protein PWP24_1120 [Clostridiales bacterium]|nr:uncharacterized protein [Clostridiales bacterium]
MQDETASKPITLSRIEVNDRFWKRKMELVRTEVIPYQWAALNDAIPEASPSFCMRNFKLAGKMNQEKKEKGTSYEAPRYTFRGFEVLPEDPEHPEDKFYGFVFQDSDFSKWIEAVAYSLMNHADPELERIADGAIDIVCAAQQENGYLDTYYIINGMDGIFTNLKDHHELYCFGHLTEGAVAYYQATGKDKLLNAAIRFADFIAAYFGEEEEKCKGYPGHEIAEMALIRLFEVTGDEKYVRLARYFLLQRGTKPYYFDQENSDKRSAEKRRAGKEELRYTYYQSHLPIKEQEEAVGHAVRAVYLYSGMADVARLTKDEALWETCETLWEDIVQKKLYVTGGIGSTHIGEAFSYAYDLPNDTAYAETCASIGLVFFARRMLQIHPHAKYANVMEKALYNGILSGMALDGKSFFYVNPLEVNPVACHKDERKQHVKTVRQKWFGCACCPPNLARLISSIGSYAFTETEDTIFVHLYLGSRIEKQMGDKTVSLQVNSQLPVSGEASIQVKAKGSDLKVAIRIPDWCDDYQIEPIEGLQIECIDGYLYLQKKWEEEETIQIHFAMQAQFIVSRNEVRQNIGKTALTRGPLVYCLEGVDNGADLHLLGVDPKSEPLMIAANIQGEEIQMIQVEGTRLLKDSEAGLYQVIKEQPSQAVTLHYVPYYVWANRGENEMQVWTPITKLP